MRFCGQLSRTEAILSVTVKGGGGDGGLNELIGVKVKVCVLSLIQNI